MFNRSILMAACALALIAGCRSKQKTSNVPMPTMEQEALTTFIKTDKCDATTCDAIACVRVSEGKTGDKPSYLAQCRWTDKRTASSGTPKRCAFAHYSVDAERGGLSNMFLSEPSFGDGCVPDKAFVDLLKKELGYSGDMP